MQKRKVSNPRPKKLYDKHQREKYQHIFDERDNLTGPLKK